MNRLSMLLAVLLAFAAGTTLGFFITPAPPRVDRPATQLGGANEAAPETDQVKQPDVPAETERRNQRKPTAEPTTPRPKDPPTSDPTLNELIEKISVELPPAGSGKVTGVVLTTDRTPLANVVVRLRGRSTAPSPYRGNETPSIEEEIKALVQRRKFTDGTTLEARSGADGTFEISGLADIEYSAEAKLDGYQIWGATGTFKAGARLKLTAAPVVRVPVKVVLADGTPATSASLRQGTDPSRRNYGGGSQWLPERPYVELRPGDYYLWAVDNKNPHVASETVSVQVELGVEPAEVLLTLKETPGIKGRIITPEGAPVSWPRVGLVYYGNETPPAKPDRNLLRRMNPSRLMDQGTSYDNSSYSFTALEPGNYLVYIELNGTIAAFAAVTVSTGVVTQDLEVQPPVREECLVVWTYGPNGKLLSDVHLYLYSESKGGGGGSVGNAQLRDDGSYWLRKPSSRDPAASKWFIVGNSPSHGTKSIEVSIEQQEARLDFDAPGRLEITLSNYATSELKGRLRIVMRLKGDPRSQLPRLFEPKLGQGVWRSSPATPGTYIVEVQYSRDDWSASALATHEVIVNAGPNAVTFPTPEVYTLTVRLKEAKAGQSVSLSGPQGRWDEQQSDANGEVAFSGLGAGNYTIRLGNERMTVEVNATTTVVFAPK